MNWKKWTGLALIVLFVVANFYLIFKKDSEVARSTYINEWSAVKEQKLVVSKDKKGVVAPAEEEYVYMSGDLERFFVKEGEAVEMGTALFEYSPKNLEATIEEYEAEMTKLESERDALEDAISGLEGIVGDLAKGSGEEAIANGAVSSLIETQIYEKEAELSRVEGEIEKFEELISSANRSMGSLTVNSAISGVVKGISSNLQNPVVTITSNEKLVQGVLEEAERPEIEEGMKVMISSKNLAEKLEGTISKVSVNPKEDPEVEKESKYQFTVELAEEEGVFVGEHVDLQVTLQEVEDARTLEKATIKDGNIYVLKGNGTIEKRAVETGIKVGSLVEITSEIEKGELVVIEPGALRNKMAFFTPVEVGKIKKSTFKVLGKREILRYLGRGVLSR